jgi:Zn-dependent protease with chaperone function
MNYMRTAVLMAALTAFFLVIGYLLGGREGLTIALVVAVGMNVFAYWNSDQMVPGMSNAREVGRSACWRALAAGSVAAATRTAIVWSVRSSRSRRCSWHRPAPRWCRWRSAAEFEADRSGAELTGHPLWLASVLRKLERGAEQIPNETADAHPAMAHLYIANPLSGGGMAQLFSTHPPMEECIARLEAMAGQRLGMEPSARDPAIPWGAAARAPRKGPWARVSAVKLLGSRRGRLPGCARPAA